MKKKTLKKGSNENFKDLQKIRVASAMNETVAFILTKIVYDLYIIL